MCFTARQPNNQQSRHLGHLDLFDNYDEPQTKNNGEVFLKNYFDEQVERNKSQLFDKESKQCICNGCMMPAGLPTTEIPAVAVEENDAFRPLTCQLVDGTSTSSTAVAEEPPRPEPMRADPRSRHRRQSFACCFNFPPYRCDELKRYVEKRLAGQIVRGRPPHSFNCPTKSMLKDWAPVD